MKYIKIAPVDEHFVEAFYSKNDDSVLSINEFTAPLLEATNKFDNPGQAIGYFFYNIKQVLNREYKLRYIEYKNLGKEINDLYAKINDYLTHDKIARYKHRNDMFECQVADVIRYDIKDKNKYYIARYDILAYDPEAVGNYCDAVKRDIDGKDPKNQKEKTEIDAILKYQLDTLEYYVYKDHEHINNDVVYRVVKIKPSKLDQILHYFKMFIESEYAMIINCNYVMSNQLIYVQAMEKFYKGYSGRHNNDIPEFKTFIDNAFKLVIDATSKSMDYNNKVMDLHIKALKDFASQLDKFYDIIRNK